MTASVGSLEKWLSAVEVELESSGSLMESLHNRVAVLEGMGYKMTGMKDNSEPEVHVTAKGKGYPHPFLPFGVEGMHPEPVDPEDPKNKAPGKREL